PWSLFFTPSVVSLFQLGPDLRRDFGRRQFSVRAHGDKHRGDAATSQHVAVSSDFMGISDGFLTDLLDRDRDFQFIFEQGRFQKIARAADPREAVSYAIALPRDMQSARAQELDFGSLHETEEIGKVNDAGHVGVVKLDSAPADIRGAHA